MRRELLGWKELKVPVKVPGSFLSKLCRRHNLDKKEPGTFTGTFHTSDRAKLLGSPKHLVDLDRFRLIIQNI